MSGQAVAGVFSSLVQIFCIAVFPHNSEDSAILYFCLAELFVLVLLGAYLLMLRSPFYQYAMSNVTSEHIYSRSENAVKGSVFKETLLVFRKTLPLGFSLVLIFGVTLAIFPNFISQIDPIELQKGSFWVPISCFLIFNVFDLTGRVLAGLIKLPKQTFAIVMCCFARLAFPVLYLFTNYQPRHHGINVAFKSDGYTLTFNVILALTNGYFASLCMIYGARNVERGDLLEQAGTVLTFFLSLGLTVGSSLSFLYIEIP